MHPKKKTHTLLLLSLSPFSGLVLSATYFVMTYNSAHRTHNSSLSLSLSLSPCSFKSAAGNLSMTFVSSYSVSTSHLFWTRSLSLPEDTYSVAPSATIALFHRLSSLASSPSSPIAVTCEQVLWLLPVHLEIAEINKRPTAPNNRSSNLSSHSLK